MNQPFIADFDLERLALGELPDAEAQSLKVALEKDAEALARFNAIAASNEDILRTHPVGDVKREVESRLRQLKGNEALEAKPGFAQQLMRWAVVAACAVFAVVMVRPDPDQASGVRMKGMESRLVVHQVAQAGLERLNAGAVAQAGDRLQLSVVGAAEQHAVVCSLDGNGQVTLHFPMDGASTKLLDSPFNLPNSYELDDAPGFERFVLITSSNPISVDAILGYVRGMSPQADAQIEGLPAGLYQSSWTVKKP